MGRRETNQIFAAGNKELEKESKKNVNFSTGKIKKL